ncbi:MAG: energy transducer TonB, partial [Ferruginibacter sp.]|nr:energy transducer TonB [Ferruginibacter sp.]
VLQEEDCPAVLIEAGFINNAKDLAYLETDAAKETIAKNILSAIEKYAAQNNSHPNDLKSSEVSDRVPVVDSKLNEKVTDFNIENMLYIFNGKIIGRGKAGVHKLENVLPRSVATTLRIIEKKEAVAKYGSQGDNGAMEIVTKPKVAVNVSINKNNKDNFDKNVANANIANADTVPNNKIFTKVENEASFPGGDSAWRKYLEKNLDPTVPVKEGRPQGEYKVIVTFIVKNDGSITNVTTDKYKGSKMAEQCINLIKKGPRWVPATQNGRLVTAYRKQPITFVIQEQ